MDDGSSLKRDCSDGNAMKDLNALFACQDKSIIRSNFIKSMFRKFEKDIDNDQRNDILITKKDFDDVREEACEDLPTNNWNNIEYNESFSDFSLRYPASDCSVEVIAQTVSPQNEFTETDGMVIHLLYHDTLEKDHSDIQNSKKGNTKEISTTESSLMSIARVPELSPRYHKSNNTIRRKSIKHIDATTADCVTDIRSKQARQARRFSSQNDIKRDNQTFSTKSHAYSYDMNLESSKPVSTKATHLRRSSSSNSSISRYCSNQSSLLRYRYIQKKLQEISTRTSIDKDYCSIKSSISSMSSSRVHRMERFPKRNTLSDNSLIQIIDRVTRPTKARLSYTIETKKNLESHKQEVRV